MAVVIYAPRKDGRPDGSVTKQLQAFIHKLWEDDTLPGLHIEPINNCADPKVRTGRVNDMFRAVLFKVQASGGEPHYIFTGVWPHDEAIKIAQRSVLKTNPVNGLPELIMASEVADPVPAAPSPPPDGQPTPVRSQRVGLPAVNPRLTLEALTDELGIEPRLAERALCARGDDEIIALAEAASVEWQGLALLDLAAGRSVDQVRETLGLDEVDRVAVTASGEEERLIATLRTPAARLQFAWLEDEAELREVVEGGDFTRWRTFLHPEQRRYAERSYSGSFRLTGGAGTGKTVVLLHRARMLARRSPVPRIVLTTFTRNLAASLRQNLQLLDDGLPLAGSLGAPGIHVTGVDAAANAVLLGALPEALATAVGTVLGTEGNRAGARTANPRELWTEATASVSELPAELRSPTFLAAEYANVVLPARITTREEYLRVRRPGRGVALARGARGSVWDVVVTYRALAAVRGALDFAEVAAVAAELGASTPVVDHVLVDEGQDLTPPQWQFLRSLVAEGRDDLFIAEDSQQRIYGQPVVLSRYGIRIVGRSRRLALNYRTTEQVLRFATGVLAGSDVLDLDDEAVDSSGYRSARSGPVPTTLGVSSLGDELDRAAEVVTGWTEGGTAPETIGVLARDQRTVDLIARGLEERGAPVRQVARGAAGGRHPQLMTMHRAKGMEFSRVLIFGADATLVPASYLLQSVPDGERADLLQRERSLFYVAATRARDELVVLWEGEGSEFLRTRPAGVDSARG